jgi:hypothetical protein
VLLKFNLVELGDFMKIGHVVWMVCFLGLTSVFLVNCGSSSPTSSGGGSATATPTPSTSSTSGKQVYAFVLDSNGSGGITMVGVAGPYSNTASSNFSFSLPAAPAGTAYVVAGFFDTAMSFNMPSGATVMTPAANNYGQFYPTACPTGGSPSTTYTASASGINLVMDTANGACTFGSGQSIQYSPLTGSSVVLSGSVSQSGL